MRWATTCCKRDDMRHAVKVLRGMFDGHADEAWCDDGVRMAWLQRPGRRGSTACRCCRRASTVPRCFDSHDDEACFNDYDYEALCFNDSDDEECRGDAASHASATADASTIKTTVLRQLRRRGVDGRGDAAGMGDATMAKTRCFSGNTCRGSIDGRGDVAGVGRSFNGQDEMLRWQYPSRWCGRSRRCCRCVLMLRRRHRCSR